MRPRAGPRLTCTMPPQPPHTSCPWLVSRGLGAPRDWRLASALHYGTCPPLPLHRCRCIVVTRCCRWRAQVNEGIVVGDRSSHAPVLHLPQMFYFVAFTYAALVPPLWRRARLGDATPAPRHQGNFGRMAAATPGFVGVAALTVGSRALSLSRSLSHT